MEIANIRMSPAGFKAFMAAVSMQPRSVPEMLDLFQRKPPRGSGPGT